MCKWVFLCLITHSWVQLWGFTSKVLSYPSIMYIHVHWHNSYFKLLNRPNQSILKRKYLTRKIDFPSFSLRMKPIIQFLNLQFYHTTNYSLVMCITKFAFSLKGCFSRCLTTVCWLPSEVTFLYHYKWMSLNSFLCLTSPKGGRS